MARRSDHSRDELRRMILNAARDITEREGLRGLRARQIVKSIGYTIGTLYNLFDDLDDVIIHMNGETIDHIYETCAPVNMGGDAKENLRALARRYLQFTRTYPNLWKAVFEHNLPNNRAKPDWYVDKIIRLQGLEERAIDPLMENQDPAALKHHAIVLWTSVYGMVSVENANALPHDETVEALVDTLIDHYVDGIEVSKAENPKNTGIA